MKRYFHFIIFILIMLSSLSFSSCDEKCLHVSRDKSVVSPTCTAEGYTEYSCNSCDYTFKTDYIPPISHDIKSTVIEPTCTAEGYTENECSLCDYEFISEPTAPLGHSLKKTVKEPSCTAAGYTSALCTRCNETYLCDFKDTVEHSFALTVIAPKCTEGGYTSLRCKVCYATFISDITAPTGHTHTDTVIPPTCTESGYTSHYCSVCRSTSVSDHTPPTGHRYTNTITAPSCTEPGHTTSYCPDCTSTVIRDYKDPLGHSYTSSRVYTTSTRDGYTYHDCERCDHFYKSDHIFSKTVFTGANVANTAVLEKGLDLSYHNGELNWQQIVDEGYTFVILRAGYTGSTDTKFEEYYAAAKSAGLKVGAYFYTYAENMNEILADADQLIKILEGKKFEYPIYLDMEDKKQSDIGDKTLLTDMSIAFIEKMQSSGYFTGFYSNENWLVSFLEREELCDKYDLWYARYPQTDDPTWNTEKYGANKGIWQFTEEGVVGTHECSFDINYSYKDYASIIKQFGYNGY